MNECEGKEKERVTNGEGDNSSRKNQTTNNVIMLETNRCQRKLNITMSSRELRFGWQLKKSTVITTRTIAIAIII